jgi:hypothetical protein
LIMLTDGASVIRCDGRTDRQTDRQYCRISLPLLLEVSRDFIQYQLPV